MSKADPSKVEAVGAELEAILDKFFIMRAGTPDNSEELKRRNELGKPEVELKTALLTLFAQEMTRIIGKDEDFDGNVDHYRLYPEPVANNTLRAEQKRKAGLV